MHPCLGALSIFGAHPLEFGLLATGLLLLLLPASRTNSDLARLTKEAKSLS